MELTGILLLVFIVAGIIQLLYNTFIYSKLIRIKTGIGKVRGDNRAAPPVSVIIASRNESNNLLEHLPLILNQRYADFEVIVVDDCSLDETGEILRDFQNKFANFRTVSVKESGRFAGGKKFAITLGIKAAKNDILLFTDADCKPASALWLEKMAAAFDEKTEIVLGYGAYEKKKGLLNKLIRFDTFMIALQYFSLALSGIPYMGVGRNLAYRKELFFKNKGFANHQHVVSGDDDLFVNYAANNRNTKIVVDSCAHTISKSKSTYSDWFVQKKRHLTTGVYYNGKSKLILGIYQLSAYSFIALFIPLMAVNQLIYLIVCILLLRYLTQFIIFRSSMKRLREQDLLFLSPLFELCLFLFYPIFAFSNIVVRRNRWKN